MDNIRCSTGATSFPTGGSVYAPNLVVLECALFMSVYTVIPREPRIVRIPGTYNLGQATAEVRSLMADKSSTASYEIRFSAPGGKDAAKNIADLTTLRALILGGKVWPNIDHTLSQVPSPAQGIKEAWRDLIGIVRREAAARYHRFKASLPPVPKDLIDN